MSASPKYGDSDNTLLAKICQSFNDQFGANHPPKFLDSDNNLLFKIAQILSES